MSNIVDMDEESDVETPEVATERSPNIPKLGSQMEHLRSMKRELDFRGTLLGKTWAELSQLLGKYQSELVTKYDHLDNMLGSEGRDQITQLETSLDNKSRDIEHFQKTVHDLETKLLEKDGEIVQLRTDVHKLRNEVSIKDNLINKVQTQMAKESMEYSTEINTLKEIISVGESAMTSLDTSMELQPVSFGKRRKKSNPMNLSHQTIENTQPSSSLETSSLELPLHQFPQSSLPNPTSRLWRTGRPTSSKPAPKSNPVELQFEVEEEVVVKSEVEDDVMTALEQSTAEDGESPMTTPMKPPGCRGRKVWKHNMTPEERIVYNQATAERMRRYRERQKKKRLEHFISQMSEDSIIMGSLQDQGLIYPDTKNLQEALMNTPTSRKLQEVVSRYPTIAPKPPSIAPPFSVTSFIAPNVMATSVATTLPSGIVATGTGSSLKFLQVHGPPDALIDGTLNQMQPDAEQPDDDLIQDTDQNRNITSIGKKGPKVYFP